MSRKLIIEGNAVYEIDEECMLKKRLDNEKEEKSRRDGHGAENVVKQDKNR